MYRDNLFNELIVDNFAGGGGASVGIELATGRPVDIAINHDADAIAMHRVNHPYTTHYQEDVFAIDPEQVTGGRPVGIAWFSPDCKHFSKAKGGKPVDKKVRGLSWVILKWALSSSAPRVFFMENVEEIQTWGPLMETPGGMRPDPARAGETFKAFVAMLTKGIDKSHPAFAEACEFLKITHDSVQADRLAKGLGYSVDWRVMKACDYGAPTIRKRFYLVARRDGRPIVFPKPTHGKGAGLKPYRTAAECINWSLPCPSIFERKRPLAVNTLRRLARGIDKFVVKTPNPYIMCMNYQNPPQDPDEPLTTQTSANHHYLVSPSIMQYHTEQTKGEVRGQKATEPLQTVDAAPRYAVNAAFLSKYFSGEQQKGADLNAPVPTVTGIDHNALVAVSLMSRHGDGQDGRGKAVAEPAPTLTGECHEHLVAANLLEYYGGDDHAAAADSPIPTIPTKESHALVESHMCILRKNMDCKPLDEPAPTVTAHAGHFAQVCAYIQKLDGAQDLGRWNEVRELLNKYAGYNINEDEILILEINKVQHFISDIGMRMLKAEELKLAQGFPVDYIGNIEPYIGKKYSEAKQIGRYGNAVCPPMATALVRANCPEMCYKRPLYTVAELERAIATA